MPNAEYSVPVLLRSIRNLGMYIHVGSDSLPHVWGRHRDAAWVGTGPRVWVSLRFTSLALLYQSTK